MSFTDLQAGLMLGFAGGFTAGGLFLIFLTRPAGAAPKDVD